jgi:GNAT superfamily N-acetyltransferase
MPADAASVARSVKHFAEAFQIISGTLPGATVTTLEGFSCAYAGTPLPFFNGFFLTAPIGAGGVKRYLDIIDETREGRDHPWLLLGLEEWFPPSIEASFEAHGVYPAVRTIGMFASSLPPAAAPPPDGLSFSGRWTRAEIGDFTELNMLANQMPVELGEASVTSYFLTGPRCFPAVAYLEGKPVSAALAILLEDCIYLAWVATHPECERRGFAEATIRHVVAQAKAASGHEELSLHSTRAGLGLYERLGFREVAAFQVYGWGL